MADLTPSTPQRFPSLCHLALRRSSGWRTRLDITWLDARVLLSGGPPWPSGLQIDAPPALDFTIWAHPVLAVPCPTCGAGVGARCVRPSGHESLNLHALRCLRADHAFLERHGTGARLAFVAPGQWLIDPCGSVRD